MKWFVRTLILVTVLAVVAGIGWDRVRENLRQQQLQRVHAALARRISLHEFAGHDQSMKAVLRKLARQCDVPIVYIPKRPELDLTWLVDVPDAELPLETALRVILRQRELVAMPYGGNILLTTADSAMAKGMGQVHPLPICGPEGRLVVDAEDWRELVTGNDSEMEEHLISRRTRSRVIRMWMAGNGQFSGSFATPLEDTDNNLISLLPGSLAIADSRERQHEISALFQRLEEASSPEGRKLTGTRFAGVSPAELPIFQALERPVSVRFDNVPLAEALAELSRSQKVPIFFHYRWLFYRGNREDWRVSYSGDQVPLRQVLEEVVGPDGLEFFVQDEMIQVTSREHGFDERTGVYDVSDLLRLARLSPGDFESILTSSLGNNRGYLGDELGAFQILRPGWMVTRQSQDDHSRIARLLAQLRVGLMPREAPSLLVPVPWTTGEHNRRSVRDDNEREPMLVDLRELVYGATLAGQQNDLEQLLGFLEDSDRLAANPPTLLAHLLIVTESPPRQMAIQNLIATLVRRHRNPPPETLPIPAESVTPEWLNLSDPDAALAKRLAEEIDVDLPIQPLQSAVEQLAARFNVKLVFDTKQLNTRQDRTGYPVSLQVKDAPLYTAFQDLLHPRQMDFVVRDGQLVVTTDERAERHCIHRLYPVRDLLAGPAGMKIEEVMDAINSFSWILDEKQSYGGEAEILAVPDTDLICVSQTLAGHLRLERLLNLVREVQSAGGPGPHFAQARINGITFEAHSAAPLFTGQRKFLILELASFLDEGAGLLSVQGLRRADQQIAVIGETVVAQGNSVHRGRVRNLMEYLLRWHETLPRAAEVFEKRDPASAEKTLALFSGATDPAERAYLAFLLRFSPPPPRAAWSELAAQLKKLTQHEELGLETPLHEQLSLAMLVWAINPKTSLDELCAECKVNRSPALQIGILDRIRHLHPQQYNVGGNRDDRWIPANWSQDAKDFALGFKFASDPVLPKFLYNPGKPPPVKEPAEDPLLPNTRRRGIRMQIDLDY